MLTQVYLKKTVGAGEHTEGLSNTKLKRLQTLHISSKGNNSHSHNNFPYIFKHHMANDIVPSSKNIFLTLIFINYVLIFTAKLIP